ncbi:hypothetical protein A0256_24375 [Mucilaginibacter sp. PAMC 26640]|nr:hypothetical protein A0256_24375 [Mucilaginibacter sp. PAMC 26640]
MLTHDFQRIVTGLFVIIFIGLVIYGIYCRRKLHSFEGTGRVAEMEIWYFKQVLTWILTFSMFIVGVMYF